MASTTDRGLSLLRMVMSGVVSGKMLSFLAESETALASSTDPLNLHPKIIQSKPVLLPLIACLTFVSLEQVWSRWSRHIQKLSQHRKITVQAVLSR